MTQAKLELNVNAKQAINEFKKIEQAYSKMINKMGAGGGRGGPTSPAIRGAARGTVEQSMAGAGGELGGIFGSANKKDQQRMVNDLISGADRRATATQNLINKTKEMINVDKQLGIQSGLSAAQVFKLRAALEAEVATGTKRAAMGRRNTKVIYEQIEALKQLEQRVMTVNTKMTFMGGSGMKTQKTIRDLGAAGQGAMLGMSMLNGDIMGLAFSLIFLQFTANTMVTVGFAGIAIAGMLAVKQIKKMLDERKEIEKFSSTFFIATGNVDAYALATQTASDITENLGLSTKATEEADKALVQAMSILRSKGIDPTSDSLKVALNAFLIAKASGESFEDALKISGTTVSGYADNSVISFGNAEKSVELFDQEGGRALADMTRKIDGAGLTIGELRDMTEDVDKKTQDFTKTMSMSALGGRTLSDDMTLVNAETALFNSASLPIFKKWRDEILESADVSTTSELKIKAAFDSMALDMDETVGAENSKGQVAIAAYIGSIEDIALGAENAQKRVSAAMLEMTKALDRGEISSGQFAGVSMGASGRLSDIDAAMQGTPTGKPNQGITVNVEVKDNVVRSEQELVDALTNGLSMSANWGTIPSVGIPQ